MRFFCFHGLVGTRFYFRDTLSAAPGRSCCVLPFAAASTLQRLASFIRKVGAYRLSAVLAGLRGGHARPAGLSRVGGGHRLPRRPSSSADAGCVPRALAKLACAPLVERLACSLILAFCFRHVYMCARGIAIDQHYGQ